MLEKFKLGEKVMVPLKFTRTSGEVCAEIKKLKDVNGKKPTQYLVNIIDPKYANYQVWADESEMKKMEQINE